MPGAANLADCFGTRQYVAWKGPNTGPAEIPDHRERTHDMTHRFAILTLAGAMALVSGFAARAETMPYRYTDNVTGSLVPQEILRSAVPFDGRYADLTAEQKATLANDYESLPAGDEPPYPMYGLRHMIKPIVRYADMAAPVGSLVASVVVDSHGKPGAVTVYKSPDPEVARLVAAALSFETFKPAVCHGQPCKMDYVLRLDFPQRGGQPITTSTFNANDPNAHRLMGH